MAQIFRPGANTVAQASLLVVAAGAFLTFAAGSQLSRSPYNTKVGIPIGQPVPFSHKHHAKELGIDCRFCHTTVETSAVAGVPPTDTCMSCHSQVWPNSPLLEVVRKSEETGTPIEWAKVNSVPDFVYFNHSIHIERGISCNNCHGEVQEMHITAKGKEFRMSWCLECHNSPEDYMYAAEESDLSPREQVFELYRKVASGEELSDVEEKLAQGLSQRMPKDKQHEGVQLMKDRKINKSQLSDCYVCHH